MQVRNGRFSWRVKGFTPPPLCFLLVCFFQGHSSWGSAPPPPSRTVSPWFRPQRPLFEIRPHSEGRGVGLGLPVWGGGHNGTRDSPLIGLPNLRLCRGPNTLALQQLTTGERWLWGQGFEGERLPAHSGVIVESHTGGGDNGEMPCVPAPRFPQGGRLTRHGQGAGVVRGGPPPPFSLMLAGR